MLGCVRKHLSSPPSQEQVTTPSCHFSDCKPLRACSGNTAKPSWNDRAQPCQEGSASIHSRTPRASTWHCSCCSQLLGEVPALPILQGEQRWISLAPVLQMLPVPAEESLLLRASSLATAWAPGAQMAQGKAMPALWAEHVSTRSLCRSWQLLPCRSAKPQPALPALRTARPGSSPVPELAALRLWKRLQPSAAGTRSSRQEPVPGPHPAGTPILPSPAPHGRHPCPCVQLAPSQPQAAARGSAARYRCAERGRPEQGWECCSCSLPAPPLPGKDRNTSHLMMTAVLSQPHLKDEGRRENAHLTNSTGKLKELKSHFLQIWVGRSGEQLLRRKGASPRVSIYH